MKYLLIVVLILSAMSACYLGSSIEEEFIPSSVIGDMETLDSPEMGHVKLKFSFKQ